ncbi:MAG: bifunctional folylpolyglutamate synthase/dihydrofolate synthase, partial [Chloroflexi bacterium]|nr:bifunctional folylpolyglutamate synthase/dihydrofolate synthase [Chloroflexota bacterium]
MTMNDDGLRAYVEAMRRLLGRGGFERTGDPNEARRFRLDHVNAYLDAASRPDRRHTVHVAGSKGKGSTAAMAESVLRAAGAHTLLLTSPDLHQARERIAIDGAALGYASFAAIVERLLADSAVRGWSYFELLTVAGWIAGAEADCDWQVLEVGLGGRLDTTNAVAAKHVAVITPIDLEHTAILGDTYAAIAREKAGIVRGPCAVVTSPMRASALDAIREYVRAAGATLHEVPEECALRTLGQTLECQTFDLRTPLRTYRALRLPLLGPHQLENAAAAVRAAELAWAAADEGAELPAAAVA